MLEAFTLTAVSGQARPSRKLAAAPDRSREQRFARGTPQNQPFDLFTGR
jgi:hypothetical protein